MIPKANTTLRAVERSIRLKPTYARRPPVARWTMSSTMSTLRMPSHTLSPSTNPPRPTRMSTTTKIWANRLSTISDEPPGVLNRCLLAKYTFWVTWWMRVFLASIHWSTWKWNSANFRFTAFAEVRPRGLRLLSGGWHRRGAAQGELLLRGHDDRRVRTLHPPQLRRRPLMKCLLYGSRLDHKLARVDKLGQALLLLEGRLKRDRPHPVEGGPNGAPLTVLLLDEPPELFPAASAQGLFLRSHEQPTLPLQAPGFEAVFFEL